VSRCSAMSLVKRPTVTFFLFAALTALPACSSVPGKASPSDPAGNFSQVTANLYRGGRPDQAGVEALKQMGVKTIIDLENDDQAVATEQTWARQDGLFFIHEPMNGLETPRDAEVDDILSKINDPALQPVFVHCLQGKDRTGLIVALDRVLHQGWTPKDAHDEMMALGFNSLLIAMNHYFETKTGWED
jgi:tyrosine-protein phosphatase SIW14